MKLTIRFATAQRLKRVAALRQMTMESLAEEWLSEKLSVEDAKPLDVKGCLVPSCLRGNYVRGLCARHYARVRYLVQAGMPEGFLVLRRRILPSRGRLVADYEDGTPGDPPTPDPDTLWFFGRDPVPEPRSSSSEVGQ